MTEQTPEELPNADAPDEVVPTIPEGNSGLGPHRPRRYPPENPPADPADGSLGGEVPPDPSPSDSLTGSAAGDAPLLGGEPVVPTGHDGEEGDVENADVESTDGEPTEENTRPDGEGDEPEPEHEAEDQPES